MATRQQRTLIDKKKILKLCEKLPTDMTLRQKAEKLRCPFLRFHWHSMKKILLNRGYNNHELLNKFETSIKKALNTDDDLFDFSMNTNANKLESSSENDDNLLEF